MKKTYRVNKLGPAGCLGFIVVFLGAIAINAWALMLGIGALGHIFEQPKLFISFWEAAIVGIVLGVIGGFFKRTN